RTGVAIGEAHDPDLVHGRKETTRHPPEVSWIGHSAVTQVPLGRRRPREARRLAAARSGERGDQYTRDEADTERPRRGAVGFGLDALLQLLESIPGPALRLLRRGAQRVRGCIARRAKMLFHLFGAGANTSIAVATARGVTVVHGALLR